MTGNAMGLKHVYNCQLPSLPAPAGELHVKKQSSDQRCAKCARISREPRVEMQCSRQKMHLWGESGILDEESLFSKRRDCYPGAQLPDVRQSAVVASAFKRSMLGSARSTW